MSLSNCGQSVIRKWSDPLGCIWMGSLLHVRSNLLYS